MGEQEVPQGTTEIQASLARVDGERKFLIENAGSESARSVRFAVQAERDKNPPVSAHDLEAVFPIDEMKPGDSVSVGAIITPGTGLHFRGVVTWRNVDDSEQERIYYMSA